MCFLVGMSISCKKTDNFGNGSNSLICEKKFLELVSRKIFAGIWIFNIFDDFSHFCSNFYSTVTLYFEKNHSKEWGPGGADLEFGNPISVTKQSFMNYSLFIGSISFFVGFIIRIVIQYPYPFLSFCWFNHQVIF